MAASYQQDLLATLLPQWHQLLQGWSADGSLVAAAQEALLLEGEPQALTDLVTQWSAGDFSGIPPIVLLSSSGISGAMGAYAISTGTIYLNQDWLLTATRDQVNAVLTEELGHHLDGLLNAVDTLGDEGEYFSKLLSNHGLDSKDRPALRHETDYGLAEIDAKRVQVEQANQNSWSFVTNSANTDLAYGIAIGANGSAYIGGYTEGATGVFSSQAFNGGYTDGYILKLDANGSVLWTRLVGGQKSDGVASVATDGDDNIYACGSTEAPFDAEPFAGYYDAFVTKYSAEGERLWTRTLGTAQPDSARAIAYHGDNIYIAGGTGGNLDGNTLQGQEGDAYIAKYDRNGNKIWTRAFGSNSFGDEAWDITTDTQGHIYTSGYTNVYNGIWNNDGFVAKHDENGNVLWTTHIGTGGYAESLALAPDGSIYACGYTEIPYLNGETTTAGDGVLVKINANGIIEWTRLIGGAGGDSAHSVTVDAAGRIYVTGETTSSELHDQTMSGDRDVFVTSFSANGSRLWTKLFGSQYGEAGTGITSDAESNIYLSGYTAGNYQGLGAPSGGQIDSFVTRFRSDSPPTDITLTTSGITENSVGGTLIGTLSATDPDAGSSFTYALATGNGTSDADNNLVSFSGDLVLVKSAAVIDYETNPVLNINVQVTDNGGLTYTKALSASVLDANEAPTNLTLNSTGITENSTGGSLVGTLSATDPDAGSTFTYTLAAGNGTTDTDNNLVEIIGSEVRVKSGAVIDFETNPILNLNIQVTDNGNPGLTYTKAVTANVINVVNEDITLPTITDISVQSNNVILTFSEKVQATGINNSTFAIRVGGTPRSVSATNYDSTNQNKVTLTLSGTTAPTSSSSLQVTYSGTNSNVVKDLAGNSLGTFTNRSADTFLSGASVTSLYADYTKLTLTGTSAINGTGNAKNNTIIGNEAKNTINGAAGADVLTGLGGTDTFVYTTLANSLLGTPTNYTFDRITDLAIGQDKLDGPKTVSTSQLLELGTVATLDQSGLQGVLTATKFVANGAASFTFGSASNTRTFVAMNDGVAGFDVTKDSVVEITGYSGLLTNLAIV